MKAASQRKLVVGAMRKIPKIVAPAKSADTFVQHESNNTQILEK